jgi:hypothetical protein
MLGGLVVLIGTFTAPHRIEQTGLVTLAFACPAYAVALIAVARGTALVPVAMLLAYSAACVRRAWLIKQFEDVQRLIADAAAAMLRSERRAMRDAIISVIVALLSGGLISVVVRTASTPGGLEQALRVDTVWTFGETLGP